MSSRSSRWTVARLTGEPLPQLGLGAELLAADGTASGVFLLDEKKILLQTVRPIIFQIRQTAVVDGMGVDNDAAGSGLSENPLEP